LLNVSPMMEQCVLTPRTLQMLAEFAHAPSRVVMLSGVPMRLHHLAQSIGFKFRANLAGCSKAILQLRKPFVSAASVHVDRGPH
jgi:hypothetical protein